MHLSSCGKLIFGYRLVTAMKILVTFITLAVIYVAVVRYAKDKPLDSAPKGNGGSIADTVVPIDDESTYANGTDNDNDTVGMSHTDFVDHVRRQGISGLYAEYAQIQAEPPTGTFDASGLEANNFKNRYRDVPCYDHSRVKLTTPHPDNRTDYINANYVDGYKRKNAYIMTQGPLPETFVDFWQMVWEQETRVVVMLTRLIEGGSQKSGQYWPNPEIRSAKYGQFEIDNVGVQIHADYVQTMFVIENLKNGQSRQVVHMQFTSWPDHGIPDSPISFIRFLTKVRENQSKAVESMPNEDRIRRPLGPPTIVHCSAGIGRSGVFCTLDILCRRFEEAGLIDVRGTVEQVRSQRAFSIQMPDQYVFCHLALLKYALDVAEHRPDKKKSNAEHPPVLSKSKATSVKDDDGGDDLQTEPLCCCEYFDQDGQRNHLLALCCDCEAVDDACERLISRRPIPAELIGRVFSVVADRLFRLPCHGGAMRLRADVLLPIVSVPAMIFVAAQGPVWSIVALVGLPLAVYFMYTRCPVTGASGGGFSIPRGSPSLVATNANGRSHFFVVWALSSLVFLEGVMEIEVLPFLDILPSENFLLKCFMAAMLCCLYMVRGDPGILEQQVHVGNGVGPSELSTKQAQLQIYDGELENARRCPTCGVHQVGRAEHCRTCNVCILRRDHHCVWIDTCIGAKNHRSFIAGLLFLCLSLWYGCHLTLTTICEPMLIFDLFLFPQDCNDVYHNIHLAVCFVSAVYGLMIFFLTATFLCYQLYLVSRNLTIPEWRHLKQKGQRNGPHSKGLLRNWHRFWLGPR